MDEFIENENNLDESEFYDECGEDLDYDFTYYEVIVLIDKSLEYLSDGKKDHFLESIIEYCKSKNK